MKLILGDSVDKLKELDDNSVDSIAILSTELSSNSFNLSTLSPNINFISFLVVFTILFMLEPTTTFTFDIMYSCCYDW